jgi:sulfite reductase (NADPH) flavoprotein alpha-component
MQVSFIMFQDSNTATVTAAVVRYTTKLGPGEGVTTTHLQDRTTVGDKCPVFVSVNPGFGLPSDPTVPVICIGAGTGLAPYRAFIQERGEVLIVFGLSNTTAQ